MSSAGEHISGTLDRGSKKVYENETRIARAEMHFMEIAEKERFGGLSTHYRKTVNCNAPCQEL